MDTKSIFLFGIILGSCKTTGLMCFKCNVDLRDSNWICNENEPEYCRNSNEACLTSELNDKGALLKGCGVCPRSDNNSNVRKCKECSTNFCNRGSNLDSVQDLGNKKVSVVTSHGHGEYRLHYETSITYWEARQACIEDRGILATIKTEHQQKFIKRHFIDRINSKKNNKRELIQQVSPMDDISHVTVWVGGVSAASSGQRDQWIWTDNGTIIPYNSPNDCLGQANEVYTNWAEYNPMIPGNSTRSLCMSVSMDTGGKWLGGSCGVPANGFLCFHPYNKHTIQSVYHKGLIYTYHSELVTYEDAKAKCVQSGHTLANFEPEDLAKEVLEKLAYVFHHQGVWTKTRCFVKLPDDANVKRTICTETTILHYICQSFADKWLPLQCDTSSHLEETKPSPDKCYKNILQTAGNKFYSFPSARIGEVVVSEELCPNGVPQASILCTYYGFAITTLHQFDCEQSYSTIYDKIINQSNYRNTSDVILESFVDDFLLLTSHQNLTNKNASSAINLMNLIASAIGKGDLFYGQVTLPVLQKTVQILENINKMFLKNSTNGNIEENRNKILVTSLIRKLASKANLNETGKMYTVEAGDIKLGVQAINLSTKSDKEIKFEALKTNSSSTSYISIPRQSLEKVEVNDKRGNTQSDLRAIFLAFGDDGLFPSKGNDKPWQILSATLTDGIDTYSVPVEYSLPSIAQKDADRQCSTTSCKYYDTLIPIWSDYGCRFRSENKVEKSSSNDNDVVNCACNHTTSFSVVLSEFADPSLALDIATTVGLIICIVFLTLTIILFAFSKDLRKIRSAFIHVNLCACLVLCYFVFLIGIQRTDANILCLVSALLIHFFIVSSWGWMITESVTMYRLFAFSYDRPGAIKSGTLAFAVYVISAAIVGLTFGASVVAKNLGWGDNLRKPSCNLPNEDAFWSLYAGGRYCWLHGSALYFGFLTVVGLSLLFNFIFSIIIIRAITWGRKTVKTTNEESPTVHVTRAAMVALLLGVSWIFAIPLVVSRQKIVQEVFGWLFAISLVLQGIFIFYFLCLRRKEVRESWMKSFRESVNNRILSKLPRSRAGPADSAIPPTCFDNSSHQSSIVTPENWRQFSTTSTIKRSNSKQKKNLQETKTQNEGITKKRPSKVNVDPKQSVDEDDELKHSIDLVDFGGEQVFEGN